MVNQTSCLVAEKGWMWMGRFDDMPVSIRQRMRDSRFNLCAACVSEEAWDLIRDDSGEYTVPNPELRHYLQAIRNVEAQIEATTGGLQIICEAA